jgi:ubiquinone/menaquinone biosynthesis C-methylase UbiE
VRWVSTLREVGRDQIPQAALVCGLWSYSAGVLYPARALKLAGTSVVGPPVGDLPEGLPLSGAGRFFADRFPEPVMLDEESPHADLVDDFDRLAPLYEALVRPLSTPIFDEAIAVIGDYLASDSRALDLGCGPGRELRRIAALVPEGEVVGVDLAGGMLVTAHASTRREGVDNCAFFQADAGRLPRELTGRFDLVYSCLAHHHFPDPDAAAANALRCLRLGSVYCVVDPGPEWFNTLSAPLCRIGDPGWIGWKTPEGFRELFGGAGFVRTCWIPLLPGFGLAIGQKSFTDGG